MARRTRKGGIALPADAVPVPNREGFFAHRSGEVFASFVTSEDGGREPLPEGFAIRVSEGLEHDGEVLEVSALLEEAFPDIREERLRRESEELQREAETEREAARAGKVVVNLPECSVAIPEHLGLYVSPLGEFFATGLLDEEGALKRLPKGKAVRVEITMVDGNNNLYLKHLGNGLNGTEAFKAAFPKIMAEHGPKIMAARRFEWEARGDRAFFDSVWKSYGYHTLFERLREGLGSVA